jgi:peptidoglycan/xylan/chitin deacetylase (PgdA/CDA1 family)
LNNRVADSLLRIGWGFPLAQILAPRKSVVLMYHGVPAEGAAGVTGEVFERHILFLKRHFAFVSPQDVEHKRESTDACRVVLTFDDGFRNNVAVVAPILRKYQVPALFFVSSRHAIPGKYLWFSYLWAVEEHFRGAGFSFRGTFFDMSVAGRQRSIGLLRQILLSLAPHPAAMYQAIEEELPRLEDFVSKRELADRYAGMTVEQVAELSADPLFSIGAHTVDHPFLTKCEPAEALRQVRENRAWIQAACERSCDAIAYPGGDYSGAVVAACREAGFSRGYAISARGSRGSSLERPRIGIYSPSTDVLGFKVQWGHLLRDLRIPVG